jgi:hypothetical protein
MKEARKMQRVGNKGRRNLRRTMGGKQDEKEGPRLVREGPGAYRVA